MRLSRPILMIAPALSSSTAFAVDVSQIYDKARALETFIPWQQIRFL